MWGDTGILGNMGSLVEHVKSDSMKIHKHVSVMDIPGYNDAIAFIKLQFSFFKIIQTFLLAVTAFGFLKLSTLCTSNFCKCKIDIISN